MPFTSAVITQSLTATASGTTDFTSSGFGTPDAAILIYSAGRVGSELMASAVLGIGLWDGANQYGVGVVCADGTGFSGTARAQRNDYIAPMLSSANNTWTAGYQASAITDGIRLTMAQDNTSFSRYCTVVLLKGVNAALLTMTPNSTQDGTATSSSLGFEPGALIAIAVGVAGNTADSGSAKSTPASISYGAALAAGTHRAVGWTSANNVTNSAVASLFSETRLTTVVEGSSLTFGLEVTSWDADDFTITTRDGGTGGATVAVLALGGADLAAVLGTITTATSTGAVDTTTTGVDPDVVLLAMTSSDTAGTVKTDAQASGLSAGAASSTVNAGFAIVDEDAAGDMATESEYSATDALRIRTSSGGTGSTLVSADLSMGTEEFTVNYTTADATARKGWFLALGQGVGGDATAPVLTSGTATETGDTTATLGATTDEANGTQYWVVTTSATEPSKAQVKLGNDHADAAAAYADSDAVGSTGAKTNNATGLTASTTYYAYSMHEDAAANQSDVLYLGTFTTDAAASPPGTPSTPAFDNITKTGYRVTWSAPGSGGTVTGYEYRINAGSWVDMATALEVTVTGRTPGATDTVEVRAYGPGGDGTASTADITLPLYGFAFSTASGLVFGAIVGSLTDIEVEAEDAEWTVFVHDDADRSIVLTSSALTIDASGRLPDLTSATLDAEQYFVSFRRTSDGAWAAARLTTEDLS